MNVQVLNQMKKLFSVAVLLCGFNVQAAPMSGSGNHPASEFLSSSAMAAAGGRVLTLFTHPDFSQKLWAGTEQGGLWHSADGGITWSLATELMRGLTVSTVVADPVNADIMYVGTGDGRSRQASRRGVGMFRSADGGKSWTLLPLTQPATVGADHSRNGFIFRSVDAGKSWGLFPVYAGSETGPKNMIHKIRFDPANPNTALFMDDYANVTHSRDGGIIWSVAGKSSTCK
ncbi:MAG: hypothetical protein B7Y04_12975 [Gallionellales bacterium 24-53-125]|nr:MAG: hypothetical protein B7Y04_12975 [Gallionellales bacterium 24-53-125]